MKIWPFSKGAKSAGITWAGLTEAQRRDVTRRVASTALKMTANHYARTGGAYEVVTTPFSDQRRPSWVETGGEDKMLTPRERARIVNLQRNMMRNSPTRVAQDQQVRVNVVGTCGGKLYASFPEGYAEAADEVMRWFNRSFFPRAEFTYGKNFNWLLKTALTSMDVAGNVILVFDDGLLTGGSGTGRIRAFEGDEIANIPDDEFKKLFPTGYRQSRGFVYDESGMFAGCFVSTVQRGAATFAPGKFLTLRRDAKTAGATNWIVLGDMRRFNQGRAVSPLTAALTCLVDLHETTASEAQAAKLNAQLVGQILTDATADEGAGIGGGAFEDATGEDKEEVAEYSTKALDSIGAHFDEMPEGKKIEMIDTKRPNANIPAYIEFLTGLVGGTRGLARVYSTLKAQTSYTAFRGEQVMSWPSFEEAQQDLERDVCDWAARLAIARAVKMGAIRAQLPDDWEYMLAWQWPKMREVSEKDAQSALALKLQNGVTSLKRELGPGECEKIIAERKREKQLFDDAGLIYPGTTTSNGSIVGTSFDDDDENKEPKQEGINE